MCKHVIQLLCQRFYFCRMCSGAYPGFFKGGITGSNNIVMAFSPRTIVGGLLKKRLTKGGVTGTPGPPSYAPGVVKQLFCVLTTTCTCSYMYYVQLYAVTCIFMRGYIFFLIENSKVTLREGGRVG